MGSMGFDSTLFSSPFGPPLPSSFRNIQYGNSLSVQMPVYSGGRDTHALKAAKGMRVQAGFECEATDEARIADAIEAFFLLRRSGEILKSAEDHFHAISAQYSNIQKSVEAGLSVKFDRMKVEVALETAREAVLQATNGVEQARVALNLAMGTPLSTMVETLPEDGFPLPEQELEDLEKELLSKNPSLKAAWQQTEVARAAARAQASDRKPAVVFQWTVDNTGKEFPPNENGWTMAGVVDFKVFDGGLRKARGGLAFQQAREAEARTEGIRRDLTAALRNAFLGFRNAQKRLEVTSKAEEAAREEVRLSQVQHEAGLITLTDHLENIAQLTQARTGKISARFDLYLSGIQLLRLSGRLDRKFVDSL